MKPGKRILFVERNTDGTIGGSSICLMEILQHLDPGRFSPVALFYQSNKLMSEFSRHGEVILAERPATTRFGMEVPGRFAVAANLLLGKPWSFVNLFLRQIYRWCRLIRQHGIDIVHINNSIYDCRDWVIAAKLSGRPLVAHQRGYGDKGREPYAKKIDKIICISTDVRRYLVHNDPSLEDRTVVIHDGIDPEGLASRIRKSPDQVRNEFGIGPDELLIAMVGNIKEWKGQEVLVAALALLKKTSPPFRCIIVGDVSKYPSDRAYLRRIREMIRDKGLGDRILLTGYRDDVPEIVNAVDILVHASIAPEPMGRVILEGMSFRRCVIATAHGGPLEIIEDGKSGFLVPPKDPEALADCIDRLKASPGDRRLVGWNASQRVAKEFHIKKNVAKIQEVYESLLDGDRRFIARPNVGIR
jgi:glycosyltransferase involved in cell wall biosynthesis